MRLTLEVTASLNVQVFLPNDAGGPGVAAPLVDVAVTQAPSYSREQQGPGSGLTFPKLRATTSYEVNAIEMGGEERSVQAMQTTPAVPVRVHRPQNATSARAGNFIPFLTIQRPEPQNGNKYGRIAGHLC